jgi:hypothetical protein
MLHQDSTISPWSFHSEHTLCAIYIFFDLRERHFAKNFLAQQLRPRNVLKPKRSARDCIYITQPDPRKKTWLVDFSERGEGWVK